MHQSVEVELEDDEDAVAWSQSDLSRRQSLAAELASSREDEVLALHDTKSRHYVDNLCSLVTGNMAIICWVLGGVYISRPCTKPLSAFLIVLGFLAPFAACLPIVVRQWVYLHLRLKNIVTIAILAMSALYAVWLMLGQRWAFESSSKNCDADLSTATNCVVFILYLTAVVYAAKVIWYLALRARYSYKELIASCFRDPFPNTLQMSDDDFTRLEAEVSVSNDETHHPRGVRRPLALLALTIGAWSEASSAVVQQKLYGLPTGLAYYVQVAVGEPVYPSNSSQNTFNLLVDTGSANTAIVTADCCSSTNTALYSCSASSTCADQSQDISVSYITGSWSGNFVKDTFSSSELGVISSFPFAEIEQESNFIASGYDGIIGLGFPSIASPQSNPPTPYFETIQSAKSLPNVFSLLMCGALQSLMAENVDIDDALYAGELLLGGTEGKTGETYYKDELVYTPLVQERWFNVIVTNLAVGSSRLDVDCQDINSPRAIIDSGTSNIAFPSDVYTAVVDELKSQVQKVFPEMDSSFFSDETPCCSTVCNPTDSNSSLLSLPGLSISLALDDHSDQQITVTIPPEYIWRPILLTTTFGVRACRVFGISEGDITLLGDVFMDGLFTVHDRDSLRIGLGVAKSCPNKISSTKTVRVESLGSSHSFCDCVSSSDRKKSLLASFLPFSGKPCYFWLWWMYLVVASAMIILLSIGVFIWIAWKRRRLLRELEQIRNDQRQRQRQLSTGVNSDAPTPQFNFTGGAGTPPGGPSRDLPRPSTNPHSKSTSRSPRPTMASSADLESSRQITIHTP
ncbi:hypothetical protein Poli38472_009450 [Pythium oligandrum]|uniref:Peptidase A1 domain-containing protein n=1 Tax=Pythium oligandrum TaxID=41045 RepID=A0A8K1CEQ7_PYTOL|nr:hypothetical protein Poli38472_009450 [Pythium oligandrum]|eukprot:TMW61957.1 hypothetical protein Poli38472_009450 [Pythium oligandrum]